LADWVKLLVVDDSKLIRRFLCDTFSGTDDVRVVGEAADGREAIEMLPRLDPDVITLDVNMPVMDGLTALKHIMIKHPKPTVMLSAYTQEGEKVTFDALKYGAVDFIAKPNQLGPCSLEEQRQKIVEKVLTAARLDLSAAHYFRSAPAPKAKKTEPAAECRFVVAMGASSGGYGSLLKILPQLRSDLPVCFLIILYATPEHVDRFAVYLNEESALLVKRARDGERIQGGACYLATGDEYLTIRLDADHHSLCVHPRPFRNHRGAINMLMFSTAEVLKERTIGVLLSGSGEDGSEGLEAVARAGGITVVQDPRSCLCQEMPRAALRRYPVKIVLPDGQISFSLNSLLLPIPNRPRSQGTENTPTR